MGAFDDLVPQKGGAFSDLVPAKEAKKDKSIGDWIADTFGPNGNLRGSSLGGVVQGMADAGTGAVQFLSHGLDRVPVVGQVKALADKLTGLDSASIDKAIANKMAEYESARAESGRDGFDAARMTGNVLSPANLVAASAKIPMAASWLGRAGQGAAIGGASAAMEPVTDVSGGYAKKKAGQMAAGAVGGAIANPLLAKGGEMLTRSLTKHSGPADYQAAETALREALQATGQKLDDIPAGQWPAMVKQAAEAMQSGGTMDAAAALRRADFEALGMKPLLGQITRDPTQYAREMNLRGVQGVGEPIMGRMTEQQRRLQELIGSAAEGAGEKYQAGRMLLDDLGAADDFMSKHVSSLYKQARESAGKDLDVPLQGLAQDYARILRDFGDKLPAGVRNNLNELGLLKGSQTKVFTVEDADRLLKVINSNASNDPAVNAALSQMRGAVKNAVNSVADDGGVFAPAVKAAKERFAIHDAVPALRAAADSSIAPDDFVRRFIVGGKTEEVHGLSQILSSEARKEAKAQIGDYLRRAAYGANATGDKSFSQERFNKALLDLGTDKLKAFFSGAEIEGLKRMGRVGAYMSSAPAGAPVNSSNTAATALNFAQMIPGLGKVASAVGAVGRTIASPVRNNALAGTALDATPPVTAAPLTEAQSNMLAKILAGGSAVGGGLLSPSM